MPNDIKATLQAFEAELSQKAERDTQTYKDKYQEHYKA